MSEPERRINNNIIRKLLNGDRVRIGTRHNTIESTNLHTYLRDRQGKFNKKNIYYNYTTNEITTFLFVCCTSIQFCSVCRIAISQAIKRTIEKEENDVRWHERDICVLVSAETVPLFNWFHVFLFFNKTIPSMCMCAAFLLYAHTSVFSSYSDFFFLFSCGHFLSILPFCG